MTDSKQPLAQPTGDAELDRTAAGSDHDAGQTGQLLDATTVFRDVTDQTVMRRQLEVADRLASLGTATSGISHEISNPLAIVMANAGYVRGEIDEIRAALQLLDSDRARELAGRLRELSEVQAEISSASSRISKIVADLKVFARPALRPSSEADIARAIGWAVRTTAHEFRHRARLTQDVPVVQAALADETRLGHVVINLLRNAAQVIAPGRANDNEVVIRVRTEQRRIIIEVRDTGPGIPPDDLRRIFEPFFTTKPTGHGLGLAAVAGIVRAHGGGLRLATAPGAGARFQVLWPSSFTPLEMPAVSPPASGHTVLVIDDEDLVRDVVARMIEDLGYAAITATDGPAGLAIVDSLPIDAVLVDLSMPRMGGADVVDALRERRPELPIVLCSGFDRDGRSIRADAYLPKPFRIDALDQTLSRLLPRWPGQDIARKS